MSEREDHPIYQGRDWFSYRWTVAQVFDALDHIHDLCFGVQSSDTQNMITDEGLPVSYLEDMCGILEAHLSLAYADTLPKRSTADLFTHEWTCFEARQTHAFMRETIYEVAEIKDEHLQRIVTLVLALKEYIKKIDT